MMVEDERYLREQIITYLGNKRALLPLIQSGVSFVQNRLNKRKISCLDLFSGSGIVARFLKQHASFLVANDLENYSRIINECYLSNRSQINWNELADWHETLLAAIQSNWQSRFITELYSPKNEGEIQKGERVFYTRRNATYIDTARECIESIPPPLKKYFLAPLLYEASVHNNTSGVFKGFYKNAQGVGQFGGTGRNALGRIMGEITIKLPVFSRFECDYRVLQADAKEVVSSIADIDLAYFDPPYNQHPYGSNYFMLNLIADNRPPSHISRISGIPGDWNRSPYNKRFSAHKELMDVLETCPARFILISYNSEGFIPYDELFQSLSRLGEVRALESEYHTFRGSRNLRSRAMTVTEYLFLLEKA